MKRPRHSRLRWAWVALAALLAFPSRALPWLAAQEAETPVDLLLRGGLVLDGTGTSARRADVAIRGDRIVAVGDLAEEVAGRTLERGKS